MRETITAAQRALQSLFWASVLLNLCGQHVRAAEEPASLLSRTMERFSSAFRALERGLGENVGAEVEHPARQLEEACQTFPEGAPALEGEEAVAFAAHARSIGQLAVDIRTLAAAARLEPARLALEEMRHVCVTCHTRFRRADLEHSPFPARGNTVAGKVRVVTPDGDSRADHADVVVFLDGVSGAFSLPRQNPVISQKGRQFLPRVVPVLKGTTIDFPNDDTLFHNVFSLSKPCPFDLDIYRPGESKSVAFRDPGLVTVYCNIHPDMISSILVLENPHYAVSDKTGFFIITGAPDGTHLLRTWHQFGGELRREVTLSGGTTHQLALEVREDRRTIKHANKFGLPYRNKYQ